MKKFLPILILLFGSAHALAEQLTLASVSAQISETQANPQIPKNDLASYAMNLANAQYKFGGNSNEVCSANTFAQQQELAAEPAQESNAPAIEHNTMSNLISYAKTLLNTPYKFGGNSPESGFDCSGFVRYVYKKSVGWLLPHSSSEISHEGEKLQASDLAPGDLVFYNTRHKPFSHVGIYIGDNKFIHSPSEGRSIEVINMREKYWRTRYNGARRILPQT
jgi:cell wall-associated NlpC family hydrolase